MITIPIITKKAPKNWTKVNLSPRKKDANIMVDIGPTPATIAKLDELIILIEVLTKKDGITVANIAIRSPKPYTCQVLLRWYEKSWITKFEQTRSCDSW